MLTGAHCMAAIPMEELGVLVGDHSLFTISTSQKFIKIKEKIIHPDYNMRGNVSSPLNNDIGLLRLEFPIIFTSQISPLCLPALGETGFGTTSAYGSANTQPTTRDIYISTYLCPGRATPRWAPWTPRAWRSWVRTPRCSAGA